MGRPSPRPARKLALALVLGGCAPDTVSPGAGSGTGTGDEAPMAETVTLSLYRGADILFVIDNSGSMAEEQTKLALVIDELLASLPPDVRIGVTTTDLGNPWCEGTTPEAGALVATSCRSRAQDFVFSGAQPPPTESPCLDVCPEEWTEIGLPDPWIELRTPGEDNLPDGLSPDVALACILPQGINGCGFEQHLESIAATLRRSSTEGDPARGFLRPDALLAIVVLTDEVDCSYDSDHETIFAAEGDRVFWSDPDASAPSSAVCWNAGVACTGSPDDYACQAADLGLDGEPVAPGTAATDAVLRPAAGYVHTLRELEIEKQRIAPGHEILVALISGVGEDGRPVYADSDADPTFQSDFGIGPGCQSNAGRAVPPVRMLQLADAFRVGDRRNTFSVCAEDYGPALAEIADAIAAQAGPTCVPMCVAPDGTCEVSMRTLAPDATTAEIAIPACAPGGALPSEDVDICATATPGVSPQCRAGGGNLELLFTHREGTRLPPDATVIARCEPSLDPAADCPAPS